MEPRGFEHGGISSLLITNIVFTTKKYYCARELFEDDDTNLEIDRLNLVQLLERL